MSNLSTNKPPIWFWIVSVIALIWNAMGVMQYLGQAYNTESFKAQYTAEQLEMMSNTPAWVTAAFAVGVFAGLLGSVALLLRKKWAYNLFLLSLLGVIVQMFHNLFIVKSVEIYGPAAVIMTGMILVLALVFLWLSKKAIAKKWVS